MASGDALEMRLLVLAPLGRDAGVLCGALSDAGLLCANCADAADLQGKLLEGAGAVLLTQEALSKTTVSALQAYCAAQPTWSDLPLVLLVAEARQGLRALRLDNVTVLERPTRTPTLVTVARAALRARAWQYQVRDSLTQQKAVNDQLEQRVLARTAELQAAYAETEAERRRVTTILESITDAFTTLDKTFRFTYLNPKGEELVGQLAGLNPDDLLGKTMWEAFPGSAGSVFEANYRRALNEQTPITFEAFFEPLNTWFEVHVYPSSDGLSIYFHDISERKQAEQTLRASEERFSKAFRAGPMAAAITTVEGGRFLDANQSFEKLTGYAREEIVGRTNAELGMWSSQEDRATLLEALRGGSYRDLGLQIETKRGEVKDIIASAETMEIAGEASLLHMFYDVTDQKRSEAELIEAIQTVMQDTAWFSHSVVERLAQARAKREGAPVSQVEVAELTPRERQVLGRMAQGHDNAHIAAELGLAEQTIRNYITRVYEKLGVHSRADAVVWARERGLVGY